MIRPLLANCLAASVTPVDVRDKVSVRIETTGDEIVDVGVDARDSVAACLDQAIWSLRLPGLFNRDHTFQFTL